MAIPLFLITKQVIIKFPRDETCITGEILDFLSESSTCNKHCMHTSFGPLSVRYLKRPRYFAVAEVL